MFTFPRFIGCACTLGLVCFMSVVTPLTTLATDIVPVTDTWIPLPDAWDTVAPFYDNYNNALSSDSGVTITADNYDEYVFRSVIGNWVATNSAFGEDVSLDGIISVLEADTDYYNYLIDQIQVNPLNASYRFGESAGASLRAFLGDMLEDTFGLTDIMTTSEAVGLDFPEGRVFVKAEEPDYNVTIGNGLWYVLYPGNTVYGGTNTVDGVTKDIYITNTGDVTVYLTNFRESNGVVYGVACSYESGASIYVYKNGYFNRTYSLSRSYSGSVSSGYYNIDNWGGCFWLNDTNGLYGYSTPNYYYEIWQDFFGAPVDTSDEDTTYSDPVVIINDEDPPIISPTSVYNDWSTISNYYYDTYNTDYVTYNTGDSIYNYTYYYTINNYSDDMPLWVVNGKNLPVYEFDRETFYDFSNTNYTVSEDLVWDSSFFDYVMEHIPIEIFTMLFTMLIASAFFLLFKH